VTVSGTKRADYEGVEDLRFAAKRGSLSYVGGPGRDALSPKGRLRVTARGRGGADVLYGGPFADLLDGGAGRDVLVGRSGRDRCLKGEELRMCEVRR
jgi:Ca2+-binding RTX toxin-like protein